MTSRNAPMTDPEWQQDFLHRHQLGTEYLASAQTWFSPVVRSLAAHHAGAARPILVALNGCQGSGKTTICDYLCTRLRIDHGLNVVAISLDDFYLTREERRALAASIHPLLATRGVPGTHDMALLRQILSGLLNFSVGEQLAIPRFDKATDDRHAPNDWHQICAPVDLVLLEGWCLGAPPQAAAALDEPCNILEMNEDPDGAYRNYSNEILKDEFQALYALVDQWIMLRAPSFDCVYQWRCEQEHKLAATREPGQPGQVMDDDAILRFIQHYERITRVCLETLPHKVNHLFALDHQRQLKSYRLRRHPGERP